MFAVEKSDGVKLASGFDVRQQTDVECGDRVQHKRKKKYFFFLKSPRHRNFQK